MENLKLKNLFVPYHPSKQTDWGNGNYSMLLESSASEYIKQVLVTKSKKRPGRRFFGEAYISSITEMVDGWYNSYKWLTSDKWIEGKDLDDNFQEKFYKVLHKYIGKENLETLQEKSIKLLNDNKNLFLVNGVYKKPVAPDLFLIDLEGNFNFIESKLPGDTIHLHQVAGLSLLAKYLKVKEKVRVCVSIVNLYPEYFNPITEYSKFYDIA